MSEEEKKAIDEIDNSYDYNTGWVECEAKTWYIVTKLIDRLQKELEKAKKQLDLDYVDNNFVSKDKIMNKIKEYDDMIQATYNDPTYQGDIRRGTCREVKVVLDDLLKENNI